jgi:hypothetical protein
MSEVFVFGSNRQGRHGLGAAKEARERWGAIYGVAEGRQGDSYAIVTKELRRSEPPVSLLEVKLGITRFLRYAESHPSLTFHLTKVGCGLAGFDEQVISALFKDAPRNVIRPRGW